MDVQLTNENARDVFAGMFFLPFTYSKTDDDLLLFVSMTSSNPSIP